MRRQLSKRDSFKKVFPELQERKKEREKICYNFPFLNKRSDMGRKRDDGSIELFYRLRNENKSADANFAHK